jgi:hypothetical protein
MNNAFLTQIMPIVKVFGYTLSSAINKVESKLKIVHTFIRNNN